MSLRRGRLGLRSLTATLRATAALTPGQMSDMSRCLNHCVLLRSGSAPLAGLDQGSSFAYRRGRLATGLRHLARPRGGGWDGVGLIAPQSLGSPTGWANPAATTLLRARLHPTTLRVGFILGKVYGSVVVSIVDAFASVASPLSPPI